MTCYPEPTLDEMLSDAVIQAVMDADAIDPDELRVMLRRVGAARRKSLPT